MPPKEATAATEITEIAMIPAEDKEEGVFLFGESCLFDPLSPLDSLEELDPLDKMGVIRFAGNGAIGTCVLTRRRTAGIRTFARTGIYRNPFVYGR